MAKRRVVQQALFLTVSVYLERKLQKLYEQLETAHYFRKQSSSVQEDNLGDVLVQWYPSAFTALSLLRLLNYVAYACNASSFHTMSNRLQQVLLSERFATNTSKVLSVFLGGAALVRLLSLVTVQSGQFRTQFGGFSAKASRTHCDRPPVRFSDRNGTESLHPVSQLPQNACAICKRCFWQRTPTVLIVSGFVFCASCLRQHLAADRSCPVTRQPVALAPFDSVTFTLHIDE